MCWWSSSAGHRARSAGTGCRSSTPTFCSTSVDIEGTRGRGSRSPAGDSKQVEPLPGTPHQAARGDGEHARGVLALLRLPFPLLLLHACTISRRECAHEPQFRKYFYPEPAERDSLGEAAAAAADTHADAIAAASKARAAARAPSASRRRHPSCTPSDRGRRIANFYVKTGRCKFGRRVPLQPPAGNTRLIPRKRAREKRGSRVQGHAVRRVRRVMPSVSSVGVLVAVAIRRSLAPSSGGEYRSFIFATRPIPV